MTKFAFLCLAILIAFPSFSAMKTFSPQENIKASDINNNFNEIQSALSQRNGSIDFESFGSGSVIYKNSFEDEFDKARSLGIIIDALSSEQIIAEELNNAFAQLLAGVQIFDDIPVSSDISFVTNEDTATIVLFNYINVIGQNVVQIVTQPTHGILTPSGNTFIYTPNANYFGNDSFSYRVFDGTTTSNTSQVSILVASVNDIPIANTQSVSVNEDSSLAIVLSGSDVEGSSLTYSVLTSPSHGSIAVNGTSVEYSPSLNYFGSDSFTFKVNDGTDDSIVSTINIDVASINDIPIVSGNQSLAVIQNLAVSGSVSVTDIESSSFTYSLGATPAKGTVSFGSNGAYTYTTSANTFGSDSFTIVANDGSGNSAQYPINVFISVPTNCKTLLAARPSLLNQNNTYYIDIDGDAGPLAPAQVACDMTTDGGGWTNLAANIGSFSNVFVASNNAATVPITNLGISLSSNANSIVNGTLVSQTADSIGACVGNIRYLKLTPQILGYLNPTAVKMTAKSYGSGPYSCGGLLRYSDLSIPAVTKINPTSFDSRTLGRCDGGGFYPSTSTSVDLTFFTTFTNTDFSSNRTIGALEVQCGTGTGYVQYKAIWVR